MAYVFERHSKYDPPDLPLRLIQAIRRFDPILVAESEMRMDRAAREYWAKYAQCNDYEQAVAVAQGILTHDELESDDFAHILWKRRP
jgi:transcription elongation factor GreA-like protein